MPNPLILLGVIGRPHGVRGLVRVVSYTADPSDLTAYGVLSDAQGRQFDLVWRAAGTAEISEVIDGRRVKVASREAAETLTNVKLFVARGKLPPPDEDEFYFSDVIGLTAVDAGGTAVGIVTVVHDYGAGASIEIERAGQSPLMLPFTRACVPEVDTKAGRIVVMPPDEILVPDDSREAAE